ncbi:MAG: permease [Candidatus Altiarchaeia archaeon]
MDEEDRFALIILAILAFYFAPGFVPETGYRTANPIANGFFMLYFYIREYSLVLVPVLFFAGAIASFISKEELTKQLSKGREDFGAYVWALWAGFLLSIYSYTILPLFAGIRKKGTKLGPAMTFLYMASSVNVLSIVFAGVVLGWDIAFAAALFAALSAYLIGFFMNDLFDDEKTRYKGLFQYLDDKKQRRGFKELDTLPPHDAQGVSFLLLSLAAMIAVAAMDLDWMLKGGVFLLLALLVVYQVRGGFTRKEIVYWINETYIFFMEIIPLLLVAIFIAGMFSSAVKDNSLADYVKGNNIFSSLVAALLGISIYYPALIEVPLAKVLLDLGMDRGAIVAFLLAAYVLSPPTMLFLRRIIGTEKTRAYVLLVLLCCTLSGIVYGIATGVIRLY